MRSLFQTLRYTILESQGSDHIYIYYNMYSTKIIVFLHCSNSNYRNNIYRSDFKDIEKNPCKIHIKIYRLEYIIFPPYTEMRLLDEYLMDRDWNSRGRVLDTRVRVSMKNGIFFLLKYTIIIIIVFIIHGTRFFTRKCVADSWRTLKSCYFLF